MSSAAHSLRWHAFVPAVAMHAADPWIASAMPDLVMASFAMALAIGRLCIDWANGRPDALDRTLRAVADLSADWLIPDSVPALVIDFAGSARVFEPHEALRGSRNRFVPPQAETTLPMAGR
jgi:hypothetical protein